MGRTPRLSGLAHGAGLDTFQLIVRYAAPIFLLVLVLVFALLEPRFMHPLNLLNLLRQVSISGLIAVGMTFVILTAGIDLSVGSLLALSGLVCAMVSKAASPTVSRSRSGHRRAIRFILPLRRRLASGWPLGSCRGWW